MTKTEYEIEGINEGKSFEIPEPRMVDIDAYDKAKLAHLKEHTDELENDVLKMVVMEKAEKDANMAALANIISRATGDDVDPQTIKENAPPHMIGDMVQDMLDMIDEAAGDGDDEKNA